MSDVTNSSHVRQTFYSPLIPSSSTIVTRLRANNVRRGFSQSQADLYLSSKLFLSCQSQNQRTSLNGVIDIDNSHSPSILTPCSNGQNTPTLSKTPISATTTALMMINKQYSNSTTPCLPPIINHHPHNTKSVSFYEKRHSNPV